MLLTGPKPKPIELKILEGNPGKRPLPTNTPKPSADGIRCPRWLEPAARAEWRRVMPELRRLGLMTLVDVAALAGYCQAYARWRQAEEVLTRNGMVMEIERTDKNGKPIGAYYQQRPEVSIAQKYLGIVKAFCAEFGLTPSSRGRLNLPGEAEDSLDAILG